MEQFGYTRNMDLLDPYSEKTDVIGKYGFSQVGDTLHIYNLENGKTLGTYDSITQTKLGYDGLYFVREEKNCPRNNIKSTYSPKKDDTVHRVVYYLSKIGEIKVSYERETSRYGELDLVEGNKNVYLLEYNYNYYSDKNKDNVYKLDKGIVTQCISNLDIKDKMDYSQDKARPFAYIVDELGFKNHVTQIINLENADREIIDNGED